MNNKVTTTQTVTKKVKGSTVTASVASFSPSQGDIFLSKVKNELFEAQQEMKRFSSATAPRYWHRLDAKITTLEMVLHWAQVTGLSSDQGSIQG